MNGLTAYALSKKYTEESLKGAGALKGEKGEDGLSIKALSITQDSTGKIIDATATLSDNTTLKVDVVTSEAPTEERLEGDGAEYYTLAPTALSFRSTAPLNELQDVQINGVTVDPSNYTLEEGSTIVTFPIDYLKTLDVGNYEVTVASDSKTVKGDFNVKAPELNEYGFYYNQPYTAYVDYFQANITFFVREDGTLNAIANGDIETCAYIVSDNNMVVTSVSMGELHCTISTDGIYCTEINTNFVLGDTSIVADRDFIYTYKEILGGYEVTVIDNTKTVYGVIKTGINGIDTIALANNAFYVEDFDKQSALVDITIPDSVQSIGENAFRQCHNLESVKIGNGVIDIGASAFLNCFHLKSITIPDSVVYIGKQVFLGCSGLESVVISNGVTGISDNTFGGCTSLINITIPENVIVIGKSAFSGCTGLTSVMIPNSVTNINDNAFKNCTGLTNITIPDSVTSIGEMAFYNCSSVTSVIIGGGVNSIGNQAFFNCPSLENITVADNNVKYRSADNCLIRNNTLVLGCKNSVIPNDGSITNIGENAFDGCTSLTSITIPDSVTIIGKYAFRNCSSLASVVIPEGVTIIGRGAFGDCTGLTSIVFEDTIIQWKAISKGDIYGEWYNNVPATHVQCSDGQVEL